MRTSRLRRSLQAFGLVACLWPAILAGQTRAIDTRRSVLIIHVFKSGLFSGFAHNHEIAAAIAEGDVKLTQPLRVSLRVDTRKMRVLDPETLRIPVLKYSEGCKGQPCSTAGDSPISLFNQQGLSRRAMTAGSCMEI